MRLRELVDTYVAFKRDLGMRFDTEAALLASFCRAMGDIEAGKVKRAAVLAFIGCHTERGASRAHYKSLRAFYRYAQDRGYVRISPLPKSPPQFRPAQGPYIYSVAQIKRLLHATDSLSTRISPLQPLTYRTLLLLLYGSGLRIGEALALTLHDVDLAQGMLTIRETKFFKTRLVPVGPRLLRAMRRYACLRRNLPLPRAEASAFFATRTGHFLFYDHVGMVFRRLRQLAGIRREASPRRQPCLHDLRHTSATHRLIAWYRDGEDVQQLLPHMATYLGHKDIESTQRYLTLTPELLRHASRRFAQYARAEKHHG